MPEVARDLEQLPPQHALCPSHFLDGGSRFGFAPGSLKVLICLSSFPPFYGVSTVHFYFVVLGSFIFPFVAADLFRARRMFFRARRLAGRALWRNNPRARKRSAIYKCAPYLADKSL